MSRFKSKYRKFFLKGFVKNVQNFLNDIFKIVTGPNFPKESDQCLTKSWIHTASFQ